MSIESALKEAGLRVTGHRLALLGTLALARGPKTADEIHARMDAADLVTIYRNLQSLVKAGFVREVRFKDSVVRYELADEHEHHHHLVCTGCGTVEELHDCDVGTIEKKILKSARGFATIDEHALEFFGTCRACAAK